MLHRDGPFGHEPAVRFRCAGPTRHGGRRRLSTGSGWSMTEPAKDPGPQRSMSLVQTFKAVGSALFGVRSSSGHRTDMSQLNPIHVIVAGLLAVALFIGLLILFAKLMLRASGAS